MAPPKAKDPEKDPWSWVPNVNPSDVSEEHVKSAYRINVPRCGNKLHKRNCRLNPYCLSRLGEERWSDAKNLNCDQVNDPEKERRKEGTYVGLKNLGATCYVNSLLQLWFHNLNFRKAIFRWDPLQDPLPEDQQTIAVIEEKEILKQLQSVFALMQYGKKRFVDPTDFISSLRLDTSIQQDAQEFSKLFLSKLESVLSYQSQKEVRDLIIDNFCGEYVYVTRCMKCQMESKRPSQFYELDLNIKGNKTIQDCLKDFMKIEILEGDNKYFCTLCNEKQDAQRFISLTELPPVLNLQLMRFLYDKNTGHKKKLNTAIQFPEKLDMSEFCENVKGGLEYTLSAVLVHGGRSANSGHYVALICDSETGTWYKFNDETVEKIDAKKLKFAIEDDCEVTDGAKKNKVQKAPPKGSYHSINAYMLVYTRVDPLEAVAESSEIKVEEWCLPSHLEELVSNQNEQFESWVSEIKQYNDATVGRSLNQQDEMVSIITMLPVDSDSEDFDAIPTSFLTKWLASPDSDLTKPTLLKLTCEHAKLDPNVVADVKYINSEIADKLIDRYGGDHRFRSQEFQCHKCVAARCFKMRVKSKTTEENSYILKRIKNFSNELEKSYWVGKWSIKSWRRLALDNLGHGLYDKNRMALLEDVHLAKNSASEDEANKENSVQVNSTNCTIVQNGILNTDSVYSDSEISGTGTNSNKCSPTSDCADKQMINSLQNDVFCNTENDEILNDVNDAQQPVGYGDEYINFLKSRRQCQSGADMHVDSDESRTNGNGNDFSSLNEPAGVENTLASSNNTIDVKGDTCSDRYNNTIESCVKRKLEEDEVSSNAERKFNEDILCFHGNLCIEESTKRRLVPEDVWQIFKKYFPSGREFTSDTEPCNLCKNIASEDEVAKDKHRSRAFEEKHTLSDLYHERSRPQLPADIQYDCKFYVLNKEFYNSWRKFIKEAGKKEPPNSIQNRTALLCPEHGKMLYDLNVEIPYSLMMFILPREWEYLTSIYSADHEISVDCLANGSVIITNPSVCDTCMNNRLAYEKQIQLTYTNAKIYVHVVKEEIIDESSQQSSDEWRPPKRAKLANSVSSTTTSTTTTAAIATATTNCGTYKTSAAAAVAIKVNSSSSHQNGENGNMMKSNGLDDAINNPVVCCSVESSTSCQHLSNVNDPLVNGNDNNNNDSNGNVLCHNLNNPQVNGKTSPPYNGGGKGSASGGASVVGCAAGEPMAVRRSARARRGDKKIEINVSSNFVLLDIKKKILEMMEVIPSDQHLFMADGRELIENSATLADLSIFPETVLTLKVDKPCAGNDSDDFSISREREQGFVGTILTSGPSVDRCLQQNEATAAATLL